MSGPLLADRVKEASTTTGTGTLTLAGAVGNFRTFVAGIATGNTCYYAIVHQTVNEWEVGIGTVTDAASDTLSRDTILASSNSNLVVSLSAGTKDVFCTIPASIITSNGQGTGIFGDGNDGAQTFDGAATILSMAPVANVYTLVRDIYLASSTINLGVSIACAGFRIFCNGTLTITGKVMNNANDAAIAIGGATKAAGTIAGCVGGGNGQTGAGSTGNSVSAAIGGAAGNGGSGSSGAGGTAGTVTAPTAVQGGSEFVHSLMGAISGRINTMATILSGGSGAGSGGGDGTAGGGAGGGGGVLIVAAKVLAGAGSFEAKGGAGGVPAGGNRGGGGGGGGGAILTVSNAAFPETLTRTVTGGTGGAKTGTGVAGSDGSSGNTYHINNAQ